MINMVQLIVASTHDVMVHFLDESWAGISKHIVVIKKAGANIKEGRKNKYKFPGWGIRPTAEKSCNKLLAMAIKLPIAENRFPICITFPMA